MPYKSRSTQYIVNAYPPWSDIRSDEQSMGFQFVNSIGNRLDDLRKQLDRLNNNYFLPTSVVSDPDVYYAARIPNTVTFEVADTDELNPSFQVPAMEGTIDGTTYDIAVASGNNIEGWWTEAYPTRLSLGAVASGEHILVSGHTNLTPFDPLPVSGMSYIPTKLWVTISGGTQYMDLNDDNYLTRGLVQVKGTTRAGLDLTEEFAFVHDDTQISMNEFASIDVVRVYGVSDATEAWVNVESARFNHRYKLDPYLLDHTVDGNEMPVFWSLDSKETGGWTINLSTYQTDQIDLRLAGYVDKSTVLRQELLNQAGNNITPVDFCPEPFSDRIWVVDTNTLYCYDSKLPYPQTSQLKGRNYGGNTRMEPDSYYAVRGESVDIRYIWRRPTLGLVKHRVWVQLPSGAYQSIIDGSMTTYTTGNDSWDWGEPKTRLLRATDTFTLDQLGDYVFSMESVYSDESTSVDRRIISVIARRPERQYNLSTLGIPTIKGVDIDSEYKLWVMDTNNVKYEVQKHYDLMIIDFDRKLAYFREPYDNVRITST